MQKIYTVNYPKQDFSNKEEFEKFIWSNATEIFGTHTMLINLDNKIDSILSDTGILFHLKDRNILKYSLIKIKYSKDSWDEVFTQTVSLFQLMHVFQDKISFSLFKDIFPNDELIKLQQAVNIQNVLDLYNRLLTIDRNIMLILDDKIPVITEIALHYTNTWQQWVEIVYIKPEQYFI